MKTNRLIHCKIIWARQAQWTNGRVRLKSRLTMTILWGLLGYIHVAKRWKDMLPKVNNVLENSFNNRSSYTKKLLGIIDALSSKITFF